MKTPSFWKNKNLLSTLLCPFGCIYATITAQRLKFIKPRNVNVPVICIGNLTAGGTGKTPTALSIAKIIRQFGKNPYFVSRGYGGNLSGIIVDPKIHTAQQVGDEPLLLSRYAPVSINFERFLAAQKAVENGADIIIMDDGFQNPTLHKDISFLVFDGGFGVGNGYPLPAGPLRESLLSGIKRADAAIIIGDDQTGLRAQLGNIPIFEGRMKPLPLANTTTPAIAFAGIGRPEKFYNSLRECNVNIIKTIDFPDHHSYSESELQNLVDIAWQKDAQLVTTSKDFVKIPEKMRHHFNVLEIEIEWKNQEALSQFLRDRLSGLTIQ